jgi:hypothetical protein
MTSKQSNRYRLIYERARPLVLSASAYNVPLHVPEDYVRITAYQPDANGPILLDHAQYFDFLSELADRLWGALGKETRLFIELRSPYIHALPENLLKAEVLMGSGLLSEAEFWAKYGEHPVVWIRDCIRRDLDYPGDNSVHSITWPSAGAELVDAALIGCWERHAVRLTEA